MIRIDLGKADADKGGGKKSLLNEVRRRLSFLGGIGGGRSSRRSPFDGKALVLVGLALAMAGLPHLFFTQFKQLVIDQHQATKKKLEDNLAVLNGEVAKFQPFQAELKSYEEQKKLVKERLDVVYNLLSNRGTPVNALDAVGQDLPRRAWVSDLEFTATPSSQRIALLGQAFSNEDISDFLDKLTESIYFTDVKLEDVGQGKGEGGVDIRTFRITAKPKVKPTTISRANAGAKGQ